VAEHRLRLTFSDDSTGEIDFTGREWTGIFEPLTDPALSSRDSLHYPHQFRETVRQSPLHAFSGAVRCAFPSPTAGCSAELYGLWIWPRRSPPPSWRTYSISLPRLQFGGCGLPVATGLSTPPRCQEVVREMSGIPSRRLNDQKLFAPVGIPLCTSFSRGANIKEVQEQLGHSSSRVTLDRYSHKFPGLTRRLQADLQDVFEGVSRLSDGTITGQRDI